MGRDYMPSEERSVGEVMSGHITKHEELAELLLSKCCITGIRDKGGKYREYGDDARLQRLLAKFLKETIKGDFYIARKE